MHDSVGTRVGSKSASDEWPKIIGHWPVYEQESEWCLKKKEVRENVHKK